MLGQQFATILARTDPFDVAQGLERRVRMMDGAEIRMLIQAAAPRMNEGYRAEFLPLLSEMDEHRLRAAFVHSLKSNLRAIPLFGPNFCEGVIANIPGDRTVGLGEEHRGFRMRPVAFAIIALALVIGGAAAQHVLSTARANANTPVVLVTPEPAVPVAGSPATKPQAVPQGTQRRANTAAPAPTATPAPTTAPAQPRAIAAAPAAAPHAAPKFVAPVPRPQRTPPPGSGVKTIVAQQPKPTPTPQPTPVDVTDMPQAYTDATPLPSDATPPPAAVNTAGMRVPTPTPEPNRSWTHRLAHAAVHLVNSTLGTVGVSKKASQPKPTASPSGPQPR